MIWCGDSWLVALTLPNLHFPTGKETKKKKSKNQTHTTFECGPGSIQPGINHNERSGLSKRAIHIVYAAANPFCLPKMLRRKGWLWPLYLKQHSSM